jgi:transcriptional regulator GlxA family with amidase domain
LRFREAMGHSVLDEILHVRLEKAQALLTRREVPVSRIAALCGFRTDIELRKLFRLRFKTSMRQWRKDHAPDGEA